MEKIQLIPIDNGTAFMLFIEKTNDKKTVAVDIRIDDKITVEKITAALDFLNRNLVD